MIYAIFTLISVGVMAAVLWPLKKKMRLFLPLLLCSVACVLGFYAFVGSPEVPAKIEARKEAMAGLAFRVQQLSIAVKAEPEKPESWAELGDAFLAAGQYASAVHAYTQAVLHSGGSAAFIVKLASAQIAQAGGKLTPEAEQGLQTVLSLEPENQKARKLLATTPSAEAAVPR